MNRLLFAGASAALLALSTVPGQSAVGDFNGKWSVLIVTEKGNCDRAYRYPLVIDGGNVTYGGKNNFTVSGQVQSNGAVVVSVMQGNAGAQGTGRLGAKYGSGTWAAPEGGCSGTWKADKR